MESEYKFEESPSHESQERVSNVVLHFFRHGEAERDPNKTNQAFELSETGRKQAIDKVGGIIGESNLNQAIAFGSPRKRAQQTAAFVLAGATPDSVSGNESLEELKTKLDTDIKYGSKLFVDPRLDFHLDKNTPFGREAYESVFTNKDYLRFLVERSDALAIETNDQLASTYSRHACDIAKIVRKYVFVSNQWNKLVKGGKYKDEKLERFLGSHGGVVESFLLKVIERVRGVGERNRLLDLMPHQFDYTEGMDITIKNDGKGQIIHISFKKENKDDPEKGFTFDEDIPLEVIDEIIDETGVISEKFKEWTEGKEATEARISVFNGIRDIPYAVVSGRKPENAQEELLLENKGSCTAKHVLLKNMFDRLNIKTRFVSYRFKWSDLPVEYPEDIRQLSKQMPTCDHLFCQAFIGDKWVTVDTTWDLPLEKAGFPVNKDWDGLSDTLTAFRAGEASVYSGIQERTKLKNDLVKSYTESEKNVQPNFYNKLNEWLEKIRFTTQ